MCVHVSAEGGYVERGYAEGGYVESRRFPPSVVSAGSVRFVEETSLHTASIMKRCTLSLLLLALHWSSAFYLRAALDAMIYRRVDAMTASPFALTQSFHTSAFSPQRRTQQTGVAQHDVEVAFGSIAATKDAVAYAMARGLQTSVLGTRVVAFGSRLELLNFVGVIADSAVRASVKWDSHPVPVLL